MELIVARNPAPLRREAQMATRWGDEGRLNPHRAGPPLLLWGDRACIVCQRESPFSVTDSRRKRMIAGQKAKNFLGSRRNGARARRLFTREECAEIPLTSKSIFPDMTSKWYTFSLFESTAHSKAAHGEEARPFCCKSGAAHRSDCQRARGGSERI